MIMLLHHLKSLLMYAGGKSLVHSLEVLLIFVLEVAIPLFNYRELL